jgi:flagellar motor switch protein FliM
MSQSESESPAGSGSQTVPDHRVNPGELFHRYAADLSLAVSAYLRVAADVKVREMEEGTLDSFLESTKGEFLRTLVAVEGEEPGILFGLGHVAAGTTLEVLLGGTPSAPPAGKPVTEIESSVLAGFARVLVASLRRVFPREIAILGGPQILRGNSASASLPVPDISIWRCLFSFQVGEVEDCLDVLLPVGLLKHSSGSQDPARVNTGRTVSPEHRQRLMRLLETARASLDIRLPDQRLSFRDLVSLRPGQVLRLDHAIDQGVVCLVNGVPVASGKIARAKRKRAFVLDESPVGD